MGLSKIKAILVLLPICIIAALSATALLIALGFKFESLQNGAISGSCAWLVYALLYPLLTKNSQGT